MTLVIIAAACVVVFLVTWITVLVQEVDRERMRRAWAESDTRDLATLRAGERADHLERESALRDEIERQHELRDEARDAAENTEDVAFWLEILRHDRDYWRERACRKQRTAARKK